MHYFLAYIKKNQYFCSRKTGLVPEHIMLCRDWPFSKSAAKVLQKNEKYKLFREKTSFIRISFGRDAAL